ncbi:MAG: T9SS type A sorting domain-containing protein [Chitinophagales bacterium]
MKHILLFLSCALALSATSQKWVLPSSKWIYVNRAQAGGTITQTDTFSVLYDTVVLGKNAFRLSTGEYTYAEHDTVFYREGNVWKPTLFFNLAPHDTVTVKANVGCLKTDSFYQYVFDSVDYVILPGGDSLRSMRFHLGSERDSGFTGGTERNRYTERLSAIFDRLYFTCMNTIEDYSLCNYGDSTIPGFWMFPGKDCSPNAVNEIDEGSFEIFPNPSYELIQLSFSHPYQGTTCMLYDLEGRKLLEQPVNETQWLDVRGLTPGIYMIKAGNLVKRLQIR